MSKARSVRVSPENLDAVFAAIASGDLDALSRLSEPVSAPSTNTGSASADSGSDVASLVNSLFSRKALSFVEGASKADPTRVTAVRAVSMTSRQNLELKLQAAKANGDNLDEVVHEFVQDLVGNWIDMILTLELVTRKAKARGNEAKAALATKQENFDQLLERFERLQQRLGETSKSRYKVARLEILESELLSADPNDTITIGELKKILERITNANHHSHETILFPSDCVCDEPCCTPEQETAPATPESNVETNQASTDEPGEQPEVQATAAVASTEVTPATAEGNAEPATDATVNAAKRGTGRGKTKIKGA